MLKKLFPLLLGSAFCLATQAVTPEILMNQAIRDGKASAILTGPVADNMRRITHSTAETQAKIERMSIEPDNCHFYKFTVTQPQVPARSGAIIGDYVTVSKTKVCPDDREQSPPEVIGCMIGGQSCMPVKGATSVKP